MAVTTIIAGASVIGAQRNVWGTFTDTPGEAGGVFITGLKYVNSFNLHCSDAQEPADGPQVELNVPTNGKVTTLWSSGDFSAGNWSAIGYGGG